MAGPPGDWGVHALGHTLSFLYDTPHGATLSIMYPAWMKVMRERAGDRIKQLGGGSLVKTLLWKRPLQNWKTSSFPLEARLNVKRHPLRHPKDGDPFTDEQKPCWRY